MFGKQKKIFFEHFCTINKELNELALCNQNWTLLKHCDVKTNDMYSLYLDKKNQQQLCYTIH